MQPAYFEQLASERKITKRVRGQPRTVWDRIPGRRAETLDAMVYAHAAWSVLGNVNFDQRAAGLKAGVVGLSIAAAPRPPARRVTRASYMRD